MAANRTQPASASRGTKAERKRPVATPHSFSPGSKIPGTPRFRAFKIIQYLKHPETGEALMTPAQLQRGLDRRSIKKWAWAEHDRDVKQDGSAVSAHVHIALQCNDARSQEQVAGWFDIPVNLVKPLGGRGAFISFVRYLTHEDPNQQARGKFRYPDDKVIANFDWRAEVDAAYANPLKLPTRLDDVKVAVLKGDLTLPELREADPLMYAKNSSVLKRLAEDYRQASINAGTTMPHFEDIKLRIRTGVTLTESLMWIAGELGFEGDNYDCMMRAGMVVMGKEKPGDDGQHGADSRQHMAEGTTDEH